VIFAWSNRCDGFPGNNRGRPLGGGSIGLKNCLNVEVPCARIESLDDVAAVVGTGAVVGHHQQKFLAGGVIEPPR